jgi:hypothetical protein
MNSKLIYAPDLTERCLHMRDLPLTAVMARPSRWLERPIMIVELLSVFNPTKAVNSNTGRNASVTRHAFKLL